MLGTMTSQLASLSGVILEHLKTFPKNIRCFCRVVKITVHNIVHKLKKPTIVTFPVISQRILV